MNYKECIQKIYNANKNIVINVVCAFVIKGAAMILSFFLIPAYIDFFGDKNILGLWLTILSVINWVLVFDLGIGNGLRNQLPKYIIKNNYLEAQKLVSSTYISSLILVLILAICGTIVIQYINWNSLLNIDENVLTLSTVKMAIQIAYIGILFQFVLKIITSILYAIQRSSIVNLLALISSAMIFVIITVFPSISVESSIVTISFINIIAVNTPLLFVSVILFLGKFKKVRPSFRSWSLNSAGLVLKTGAILLWLQLTFMIISSTNEILISMFCSPYDVFVFQVYFKVFNGVAAICSLVLVPIWSAVTKAKFEKRYGWIINVYKILMGFSLCAFLLEVGVVAFLQPIVDLWLKENTIKVDCVIALIIALYNFVFLVHSVNASIGNGMSFFKPQMIFMTLAALIDIPLAWLLVKITGGWIGVILANIIVLLPYEIVEPLLFFKYINGLRKREC